MKERRERKQKRGRRESNTENMLVLRNKRCYSVTRGVRFATDRKVGSLLGMTVGLRKLGRECCCGGGTDGRLLGSSQKLREEALSRADIAVGGEKDQGRRGWQEVVITGCVKYECYFGYSREALSVRGNEETW